MHQRHGRVSTSGPATLWSGWDPVTGDGGTPEELFERSPGADAGEDVYALLAVNLALDRTFGRPANIAADSTTPR